MTMLARDAHALFDPVRTPFGVDERHFPVAGPLEDQFRFLLRYVILAPSTYNTQPWRFAVSENGIEVYADYARRMPVADPGNRELLLSIGAAVATLRVAAAHFGFACLVEYNHTGTSDRPLAVALLNPVAAHPVGDAVRARLFPAITRRRTNRREFLRTRIPRSALEAFAGIDAGRQSSLTVSVDGRLNDTVAALVGEADAQQFADQAYRDDMSAWIHPESAAVPDGIPAVATGSKGVPAPVASWAVRAVDSARRRAAQDRNLCSEAPALAVISSEDTVPHWLDAGELLQELLLTAEREGLACSYFNMPMHVPEIRARLRTLIGAPAWPQLLLRIGYCLEETPRTPRRPLEDVLVPTTIV
jgi:nitroreductase